VTRISGFEPVEPILRGGVLAVGNFDGVHRGHAHLIRRLRAHADALGVAAVALTFDPSPAVILRPEIAPEALTWPQRKVALLHSAGATQVGVFQTGRWLLGLTAREFFDRVVLGQFEARGMVEGPTFGFGRDRGGDARLLENWCRESGLDFEIVPPAEIEGQIVSSSRIRRLLAEGSVARALELLGRPHRVKGLVVPGARRGVELGFPTANLGELQSLAPGPGVYAGRAWLETSVSPFVAAIHVGPNATFGEVTLSVEAHLLGFEGNLYDQSIELDFLSLLRGTRPFESVEALRDQIERDVNETRRLVSGLPDNEGAPYIAPSSSS
jgi:riboflavin kinase/FMN adenylyltransferase